MKILQADDHPLFREGVRYLLEQLDQSVQFLEAGSIPAALDILQQHDDIDLVLLDLTMPGMNGFAGFQAIEECQPAIPIVILSASEHPKDIQQAIVAGAAGYIPKSSTSKVMIEALKEILKGGMYVPTMLYHEGEGRDFNHLTDTQHNVLKLMIAGLSNKQIASQLQVSESTIKHHVSAILKLLKVENRTQVVSKVAGTVIGSR